MIAQDDEQPTDRLAFQEAASQWFAWNTGVIENTPDTQFFNPEYWYARAAVTGSAPGRAAAYFLQPEAPPGWVLRRYRRGGVLAHLNNRYYLFSGAARSRPVRELTLLDILYRQGQPVPRPIAAMGERRGLFYTGALITEIIPDSTTWASYLSGGPLGAAHWQALGGVIAGLHRAGLCHADLNARNVLIDAAEQIFVIDFDKACFRRTGRWQAGNLNRLRRSLDKFAAREPVFHFSDADWRALETGYARALDARL